MVVMSHRVLILGSRGATMLLLQSPRPEQLTQDPQGRNVNPFDLFLEVQTLRIHATEAMTHCTGLLFRNLHEDIVLQVYSK